MPSPLPPNPPNRAWGMAPPGEPENPIIVEIEKGELTETKPEAAKPTVSNLETQPSSPKHAVSKDKPKDDEDADGGAAT